MPDQRTPLYLARASYRQRRLIDAQRLLPVLLFVLFLVPLLWGGEGTGHPIGQGAKSLVFVFVIWAIAIVATLWFSRALRRGDSNDPDGSNPEFDIVMPSQIAAKDAGEG